MKRLLHCTLILLLLDGCTSQLPGTIARPPAEPVSVREVQRDAGSHLSREVRWGGDIIEVQNHSDHTDVLVLARELKKDGEPKEDGAVDGRFIARFGSFIDPAQLPEGRLLTVSGPVIGMESHKVGEYPYRYPVVQVTAWHLWPKPRTYYHDPWWPYYPGYPWRYPYWW